MFDYSYSIDAKKIAVNGLDTANIENRLLVIMIMSFYHSFLFFSV